MATALATSFKILALGPNPALQRVLGFDGEIKFGGVNRASSCSEYVGGKGQGVALALQRWSPGSSAIAQFLGGDTGNFIEAELTRAGVECVTQQSAAATRICTTLLHAGSGGGTELIDPSGTITASELGGLVDKVGEYSARQRVGGLACCGTTPPGSESLYSSIAEQQLPEETLLLVDSSKGIDSLLESGRVDVLKINVDEAKALTGKSCAEAAAAALLGGARAPLRRPGALLALTDGPRPAQLYCASQDPSGPGTWKAYKISVPSIECVNAIGAGDVCSAIFLHELVAARMAAADGLIQPSVAADAFAWGLAAACARCMQQQPNFERGEVERMRSSVQIELLPCGAD